MSQENKDLIRRFTNAVNADDYATFDAMVADDYHHHDPNMPNSGFNGREPYKEMLRMFRAAFPDFKITIQNPMVAEGDVVAYRWNFTGTQRGELMGVQPTGKHLQFSAMEMHRIANGLLVEGWVNFDALSMMQQLGGMPGAN